MKKLLFFHAPWCPPCRCYDREIITPLGQRIGNDRIIRVNAQKNPFTAEKYGVEKLPTIVIIDGNERFMQSTGGFTVDELEKLMKESDKN